MQKRHPGGPAAGVAADEDEEAGAGVPEGGGATEKYSGVKVSMLYEAAGRAIRGDFHALPC